MFGASSFGGFGQQNQQGVNNASQPATGGLFGQPAATTGAAGTGSGAFGAPAFGQPAQTGATPAFGATTQTPAFGTTASAQHRRPCSNHSSQVQVRSGLSSLARRLDRTTPRRHSLDNSLQQCNPRRSALLARVCRRTRPSRKAQQLFHTRRFVRT